MMFGLFKKNKKDKKDEISTKNMTAAEYIAAVEWDLLPHWSDPIMCEKIGIENAFESGACVKTSINIEDALDCYARVCRILNIGTYVSKEFGNRSRKIRDDANATSNDKNMFYSATTIKSLLIEAQTNVCLKPSEDDGTCEEIVEHINEVLKTLSEIKHMVIEAAILMATLDNNHMRGFL